MQNKLKVLQQENARLHSENVRLAAAACSADTVPAAKSSVKVPASSRVAPTAAIESSPPAPAVEAVVAQAQLNPAAPVFVPAPAPAPVLVDLASSGSRLPLYQAAVPPQQPQSYLSLGKPIDLLDFGATPEDGFASPASSFHSLSSGRNASYGSTTGGSSSLASLLDSPVLMSMAAPAPLSLGFDLSQPLHQQRLDTGFSLGLRAMKPLSQLPLPSGGFDLSMPKADVNCGNNDSFGMLLPGCGLGFDDDVMMSSSAQAAPAPVAVAQPAQQPMSRDRSSSFDSITSSSNSSVLTTSSAAVTTASSTDIDQYFAAVPSPSPAPVAAVVVKGKTQQKAVNSGNTTPLSTATASTTSSTAHKRARRASSSFSHHHSSAGSPAGVLSLAALCGALIACLMALLEGASPADFEFGAAGASAHDSSSTGSSSSSSNTHLPADMNDLGSSGRGGHGGRGGFDSDYRAHAYGKYRATQEDCRCRAESSTSGAAGGDDTCFCDGTGETFENASGNGSEGSTCDAEAGNCGASSSESGGRSRANSSSSSSPALSGSEDAEMTGDDDDEGAAAAEQRKRRIVAAQAAAVPSMLLPAEASASAGIVRPAAPAAAATVPQPAVVALVPASTQPAVAIAASSLAQPLERKPYQDDPLLASRMGLPTAITSFSQLKASGSRTNGNSNGYGCGYGRKNSILSAATAGSIGGAKPQLDLSNSDNGRNDCKFDSAKALLSSAGLLSGIDAQDPKALLAHIQSLLPTFMARLGAEGAVPSAAGGSSGSGSVGIGSVPSSPRSHVSSVGLLTSASASSTASPASSYYSKAPFSSPQSEEAGATTGGGGSVHAKVALCIGLLSSWLAREATTSTSCSSDTEDDETSSHGSCGGGVVGKKRRMSQHSASTVGAPIAWV